MLSVRDRKRKLSKVGKFFKRNYLEILAYFLFYILALQASSFLSSTFSRILFNINQIEMPIKVTNYWGIFFISFTFIISIYILCFRKTK